MNKPAPQRPMIQHRDVTKACLLPTLPCASVSHESIRDLDAHKTFNACQDFVIWLHTTCKPDRFIGHAIARNCHRDAIRCNRRFTRYLGTVPGPLHFFVQLHRDGESVACWPPFAAGGGCDMMAIPNTLFTTCAVFRIRNTEYGPQAAQVVTRQPFHQPSRSLGPQGPGCSLRVCCWPSTSHQPRVMSTTSRTKDHQRSLPSG